MTEQRKRRRPRFWVLLGILVLLVIIIIAVAANLQQGRVDIYKTTLEAVRHVKANPQH